MKSNCDAVMTKPRKDRIRTLRPPKVTGSPIDLGLVITTEMKEKFAALANFYNLESEEQLKQRFGKLKKRNKDRKERK